MQSAKRLTYSGLDTDVADDAESLPAQGSYTYTTPPQPHQLSASALARDLYQSASHTSPPSPSAADPHTLTDDLLNLDSSPTLSLSIPDLDTFFTRAYEHWKEGGLRGVIGGRLVSLLVLAFSVAFSSSLLLFVDWDAVVHCSREELACERLSLLTWRHVDNPNPLTYIVSLYFGLFSLYWLSHLLSFLYSLPGVLFIHSFYRSHLSLDDEAVVSVTWGEVLQRLEAVQERERLCVVKRLNGLDITNRIMRRDNFMIALVNAQLLDVSPDWSYLWSFGRYEAIEESGADSAGKAHSSASSWMYGTMLDSIVRLCIVDFLFSSDFRLSPSFTSPHAAHWLRRRFLLFGLFTLVFLPFLFLFLVLLFVLRHAEELHAKRSLSSSRQWSLLSQWRLREYNELPHFFQRRLSLASLHASAYIEQFPSVLTSLFASAIAYCAAGVVGVLLLLGATGGVMSAYVWERSLWWWLAAFSALLAISRSFIHTPPSVSPTATSPALTFASLVSYTHYHPRQWRGLEHTATVMRDVSAMYASKFTLFANELLALLACPFVLLVLLAQRDRCERIVRYVQRVSVEVKGVGVVCQMARFELAAEGQQHQPNEEEKSSDAGRKRERTDRDNKKDAEKQRRAAKVNRGREGKMEKSFLSFVINHQHWKLGQDDEDDTADAQPQPHLAAQSNYGRDQFLLSIAEGVKHADNPVEQAYEQTRQQHAAKQRRAGRSRADAERSLSVRQRHRRASVDSLDSVSSNESLSASPVRSSRRSEDEDDDEPEDKAAPLHSPAQSVTPHALSASDRHLLVSFADLLNVATHGAGTLHPPSALSQYEAARPWLAGALLRSSTSSLYMQRSMAGQRSMLASQLGGSGGGSGRAAGKRSVWEERMDEEMRASVSERVRERMFAVLEKRVEEDEAEDEDGQGGREEEADTRLDGDGAGLDVSLRIERRVGGAASDVEMRRILQPTQRKALYQSIAIR